MANTQRYKQLAKRIKVIENSYLPATNLAGNYSCKEQDNLRAFLLLVHAEMESYFEEVAENKAKNAFKAWKNNRTKSNVLLSLVSFCKVENSDHSLEKNINASLTAYIKKLKKNHGIKEKNLLDILLPVGIEYNNLDTTWLSTMTSFGSNRGEVAHSTAKVQQPLDPVTLKNTVNLILSEIQKIDQQLKVIR
jgi:hypothetical protein